MVRSDCVWTHRSVGLGQFETYQETLELKSGLSAISDCRTLTGRIAPLLAVMLLSLVAVLPCAAQGTGASINETAVSITLYVNPITGSDGNSGTSASPFKTINRAISVAAGNLYRGTKIWLADGTYRESIDLKKAGTRITPPLRLFSRRRIRGRR